MSSTVEQLIGDFACLDPVYVDGIVAEGVVSCGPNFMIPYFRWVPTIENGHVIMQRTPALLLIRPHRRSIRENRWPCCSRLSLRRSNFWN
jgi:hypothetical protein